MMWKSTNLTSISNFILPLFTSNHFPQLVSFHWEEDPFSRSWFDSRGDLLLRGKTNSLDNHGMSIMMDCRKSRNIGRNMSLYKTTKFKRFNFNIKIVYVFEKKAKINILCSFLVNSVFLPLKNRSFIYKLIDATQ